MLPVTAMRRLEALGGISGERGESAMAAAYDREEPQDAGALYQLSCAAACWNAPITRGHPRMCVGGEPCTLKGVSTVWRGDAARPTG